jgi:hypothetical protein
MTASRQSKNGSSFSVEMAGNSFSLLSEMIEI